LVVFALTVQFAPALALVEMVPGADIELAAPATRWLPSLDAATAAQY
jgi:hypothetical protein